MSTTTVTVPTELIPAIGFLADHFLEDIRCSQGGPYEYTDQERDNTQAVMDWAIAAAEASNCKNCDLRGSAPETYHQADELAGADRRPWPNAEEVEA